jgi:hypothetical protein
MKCWVSGWVAESPRAGGLCCLLAGEEAWSTASGIGEVDGKVDAGVSCAGVHEADDDGGRQLFEGLSVCSSPKGLVGQVGDPDRVWSGKMPNLLYVPNHFPEICLILRAGSGSLKMVWIIRASRKTHISEEPSLLRKTWRSHEGSTHSKAAEFRQVV